MPRNPRRDTYSRMLDPRKRPVRFAIAQILGHYRVAVTRTGTGFKRIAHHLNTPTATLNPRVERSWVHLTFLHNGKAAEDSRSPRRCCVEGMASPVGEAFGLICGCLLPLLTRICNNLGCAQRSSNLQGLPWQ